MEEVIIVGAGLSGLSAAYHLKKEGVDALIIEARERSGGRILTAHAPANQTSVEMGATWFTDKHTYLIRLLHELKLPFFRQYQKGISIFDLYPNPPQLFDMAAHGEPSFRIGGGSSSLIKALTNSLEKERILLGSPLKAVVEKKGHLEVQTGGGDKINCKSLLICLPPYLVQAQKINFTPELPEEIKNLLNSTHTWMGEAIKFAFEYSSPFWRKKGFSGTIVSQSGIAREVYDHANQEENRFALKGFLSPAATDLSKAEREEQALEQLKRLLGPEAGNYLSYVEKVWEKEAYTFAPYGQPLLPHQHNGHPLYAQPLMNGRLQLSGAETSPHFGGYMEGAVYSGLNAAQKILHHRHL